jgi:hypothetical protein
MSDWNPFLVAIAFKRVEIVRYFIEELKISCKFACRDPTIPFTSEQDDAQAELFGIHLAIINRDLTML